MPEPERTPEVVSDEREVAERLVASGVDGIILPPPLCDSPLVLDVLLAAQVPTVVVATGSSPDGVGRVSIDDRAAARAMTAVTTGRLPWRRTRGRASRRESCR